MVSRTVVDQIVSKVSCLISGTRLLLDSIKLNMKGLQEGFEADRNTWQSNFSLAINKYEASYLREIEDLETKIENLIR
jgi:hypothetical protein